MPAPQSSVRTRASRRHRHLIAAAVLAVMVPVVTAPAALAASGRTQIQLQDRCDPTTFNAAGIDCVGKGNVTFDELVATLDPDDFGHDKWRFSREHTHIKEGEKLHLTNTGGEFHTFSEVVEFGPSPILPPDAQVLNAVFPPGTPTAEPIVDPFEVALDPGTSGDVAHALGVGVHKFECLIHPWMQSTVEVRRR
jgi:hypothetical protein